MKKLLLLIAIMLCCATAIFAQNNRISYQAVVRDANNALVANKTVNVTVNIYNGPVTETPVYRESHAGVQTNFNGMISFEIGGGNYESGNWNAIDWKTATVTTKVTQGNEVLGTLVMPLTAVPYALYADYADNLNPESAVVLDLKAKIIADSNALAGHLNDTLAYYYTQTQTDKLLGAKADTGIVYTRTIIDNKLGAKADTASLAKVAKTGSYDDLTDKPTLATVATSGSYSDLNNKPIIIDTISEYLADNHYITNSGCTGTDFCALVNQIATMTENMTNMQKTIDTLRAVCGLVFTCGISTVEDHEGNVYHTAKIGNQCWLKENMRCTTSPSTGTYIVNNGTEKRSYTGKVATWYNNDSVTAVSKGYGLLYNWNAMVDTFNTSYSEISMTPNGGKFSVSFTGHRRGICPKGWHVPTDAEWNTMEAFVCGSDWVQNMETQFAWRGSYAGKLVTGEWNTTGIAQNTTDSYPANLTYSERNNSCLSVLPAGQLNTSNLFGFDGNNAIFWTSSSDSGNSAQNAINRNLAYNQKGVNRYRNEKRNCFSVRCVRD